MLVDFSHRWLLVNSTASLCVNQFWRISISEQVCHLQILCVLHPITKLDD